MYSEAIFIEKRLAPLHIEYTRALILVFHLIDPYDSYHETDEFVRFVIIYEYVKGEMKVNGQTCPFTEEQFWNQTAKSNNFIRRT